jgi:5-methylcytosine-specific restriction endonuclease McrA
MSWSGTRKVFSPQVRLRILARDHWRCVTCGHHDPTGRTLVADHIIPVAEGGNNSMDNGQTLCDHGPRLDSCHRDKTRQEIARGHRRRPKRERPERRHPGLL